jgi:exoribonuclease-2
VDLVNQWQILAALSILPPAFQKNDSDLFSVISGFEAAYSAYAEFQSVMERYWCLRWIGQQAAGPLDARLQRDDTVVLSSVPLSLRIAPLSGVARGTRLEVEVRGIDEVDLSAETRVSAIIEEVDPDQLPDDESIAEDDPGSVASVVHT